VYFLRKKLFMYSASGICAVICMVQIIDCFQSEMWYVTLILAWVLEATTQSVHGSEFWQSLLQMGAKWSYCI
jgi:hypothetical protein